MNRNVQHLTQPVSKRYYYVYSVTTPVLFSVLCTHCNTTKGVGPGPTLAWPGWKQPDIPVEVDTGRLETDVGMQKF
jgi:hypothetical protein